ncbi:GNAT family N-acetyltransferase [Clostridiales bacterium COT073_COT-073]|nr:GNAT family N-acetyltransferase [Clostridiales bacterium COT073_COT-073]
MIIKRFEEKYRDDLIFMILQAKDALGRKPGLNEDLLDIKKNYIDSGGNFWLAVNEQDRVIGSIGYLRIPDTEEAFLHRLFVKASEKNKGIGTRLLLTAESEMREKGIKVFRVHLGTPKEQWFESYAFYTKHGYAEYKESYMKKEY